MQKNFRARFQSLKSSVIFSRKAEWMICIAFFVILVAVSSWNKRGGQRERAAAAGYSPLEWIATKDHANSFDRDYPSGIETYGASLAMWIYPAMDAMGLSDLNMVTMALALEYYILGFGIFIFLQAVIGARNRGSIWLLAAILMSFTAARNLCLGNWWQPYFSGLYYGYSDAFRLMAIGFTIQARFRWAAVTLAISVLAHPLMGAQAAVVCACIALFHWRSLRPKEVLIAAAWFLAITLPWVASMGHTKAGSPGALTDIWFQAIRAQSTHVSLVKLEKFTSRYEVTFFPFLCYLFWLAISAVDIGRYRPKVISILLGILGIGFMCALSWFNDIYQISPTVFKMSFHRSNEIIALAGMPILAAWVIDKLARGNFIDRFFVVVLVGIPFFTVLAPFNWALVVLFNAYLIYRLYMKKEPQAHARKLIWVAVFGLIIGVLPFIYWMAGFPLNILDQSKVGPLAVLPQILVVAGLVALLFYAVKRLNLSWFSLRFAACLVLILVTISGPLGGFSSAMVQVENLFMTRSKIVESPYYQLQKWVSKNTPKNALILPDPSTWYGWRAYSERSSFGNIREWLFTAIVYKTSAEQIEEGIRRAKLFGVDVKEMAAQNDLANLTPRFLKRRVYTTYYRMKRQELLNLKNEYGINYIVMNKSLMKRAPRFKLVYENDGYALFKL